MDYKRIRNRTIERREMAPETHREYYTEVLETLEMLWDSNMQLVEKNSKGLAMVAELERRLEILKDSVENLGYELKEEWPD